MNFSGGWIALLIFGVMAVLILWRAWQIARRRHKAQQWPATEAMIQSVRKVSVPQGRSRALIDVGDFTYTVSDEYYSGTLMISRSFSTGNGSPRDLVDKKVQVRYNPRKPEQNSVLPTEIGGFLLDPYDDYGTDIGPIDLNIDKI